MARRTAPAPAPAAPAAARGPQPPAPAAPIPGSADSSTSGGRQASRQWNGHGWAPTAGGVVLGALADILFVQYMRGGSAEVKAWMSAKFLNKQAAGAVGSGIGQTATVLGSIYGGGAGGNSGANAGTAPSTQAAPGGPAKGTL